MTGDTRIAARHRSRHRRALGRSSRPALGCGEVVAQVAKVQPLWALLRLEDRARYMRRMAQAIVDELDELRETIAREQGRPRTEVAALELLVAIDALKWVAQDGAGVLGGRRVGVHRSLSLTKRARIAYEPYGVVGVIGAGQRAVRATARTDRGSAAGRQWSRLQARPARCLAGERIARVLARAGLPEGLVRVIHGGADVGLELAGAPVDKLLFTGSPTTGRAVAQRVRVAREGGHGRARRQGRDARARRRPHRAGGRRGPVGGMRGRRTGAGGGRAHLRSPGGYGATRGTACVGGARAHSRRPARPARADRPARLRAASRACA